MALRAPKPHPASGGIKEAVTAMKQEEAWTEAERTHVHTAIEFSKQRGGRIDECVGCVCVSAHCLDYSEK